MSGIKIYRDDRNNESVYEIRIDDYDISRVKLPIQRYSDNSNVSDIIFWLALVYRNLEQLKDKNEALSNS